MSSTEQGQIEHDQLMARREESKAQESGGRREGEMMERTFIPRGMFRSHR
jgi:hypothetical protein